MISPSRNPYLSTSAFAEARNRIANAFFAFGEEEGITTDGLIELSTITIGLFRYWSEKVRHRLCFYMYFLVLRGEGYVREPFLVGGYSKLALMAHKFQFCITRRFLVANLCRLLFFYLTRRHEKSNALFTDIEILYIFSASFSS
jgi:hypothetical protein